MKLSLAARIASEKVTGYLLLPQARGDKSAFLARGGYHLENAEQLLTDLREQLLPLDAELLHSTAFGTLYEIRGLLTGPNGTGLRARSIWMEESLSSVTKFIT